MKTAPERRRVRPATYLLVFSAFAAVLFLTHYSFIGMPFFWDEVGYFVPAALDLYQHDAWIPRSTAPSVHPPAVMAWLSAVWNLTGFSIPATRIAMLVLAAAAATVVFQLAIELGGPTGGFPAFPAIAFLLVSPVFFTQSMMAQLDMPAMLVTAIVLLLFLRGHYTAAAAASILLVMVKGTGAAVPVALGGVLFAEGRRREALWFAAPVAVMACWLGFARFSTGQWLGNPEFAELNFYYQLHPVRMAVGLARRLYYLFIGDFHWIGTAGIALGLWRTRLFATRPWKVTAIVAAAHLAAITVTGGAQLERYALPILPLLYIAMAVGWTAARTRTSLIAHFAMAAGLVGGWFWLGPFPQPFENNLAMREAVDGQLSAASFVEKMFPDRTITTAWPLSDALRRPEFGYVEKGLRVRPIPDFRRSTIEKLAPGSVEVFIIYSREVSFWPVLDRIGLVGDLRRRFFDFEQAISSAEVTRHLDVTRLARWERGGFWIEVMAAPAKLRDRKAINVRWRSPSSPGGGDSRCCAW